VSAVIDAAGSMKRGGECPSAIATRPDLIVGPAERQRGKKAAERANLLGEMAGGIAHDFRNVLGVIGSALNLAERHAGDPEETARYLSAARESIARGLALSSRLIALARPQGQDVRPGKISALIRDIAPFLKFGAGPGITFSFVLSEQLPECMIDAGQFNAALLNLVVNARDAMPDGGEIRIAAEMKGEERCGDRRWVRVAVTDTGQGMSDATIARIFNPWFTTKGETGTGLGLPQVCALMRLVGGRVQVSSEIGKGTTFSLLFPALSGPDAPGSTGRSPEGRGAPPDQGGSSDERVAMEPMTGIGLFQDVPGAIWAMFLASWAGFFLLTWLFFAASRESSFVIAVAMLFGVMAFGLPVVIARQSNRVGYRASGRIDTHTGPVTVGTAAVQIALIPFAILIGLIAFILFAKII
jgi:two-component sensor histidine kinase